MSYATEGLSGTESTSFWNHWSIVKQNLGNIQGIGPQIKAQWERAKVLKTKTQDAGVLSQLDGELFRLSEMYATWKRANGYIQEWVGKWRSIESSVKNLIPTGFLGILPFVLPAWAAASLAAGGLAALTFVSTHGLDLIKQYQLEKNVLDQIERGIVTPGQAAVIIESGQTAPIFGGFAGMTTGIAVGALALMGFLFYQGR